MSLLAGEEISLNESRQQYFSQNERCCEAGGFVILSDKSAARFVRPTAGTLSVFICRLLNVGSAWVITYVFSLEKEREL